MCVVSLLLGFWTLFFSAEPFNAAVSTEFYGINGTMDCLRGVVGDSEINKPYDVSHFAAHSFRQRQGGPRFFLGSFSLPKYELSEYICHSRHARATAAIFVKVHCRYDAIFEDNGSSSKTDTFVRCCCKDASCQAAVLSQGELTNEIRMNQVEDPPIRYHTAGPCVSNGVDPTYGIPLLFGRVDCNGLASFFGGAPGRGSIRVAGNIERTGGYSENNLLAKCGNLAVRIVWNAFENTSTVSRHNKFTVYQLKDDDRAGTDLGICRLRNEHPNKNAGSPFHLVIKSGSNSFASGIPGKKLTCLWCQPVEVSATGKRFGIISVREQPDGGGLGQSGKHPKKTM